MPKIHVEFGVGSRQFVDADGKRTYMSFKPDAVDIDADDWGSDPHNGQTFFTKSNHKIAQYSGIVSIVKED